MATKATFAGSKRKATVASKGKSDSKTKKARLEPVAEPEQDESSDDFESFSDSDDGGAKLEDEQPKKHSKKSEGANGNFDKGTFRAEMDGLQQQITNWCSYRPNISRVARQAEAIGSRA